MKKTYLRAAIASLGLFTGTVLIDAQTAAGGGAAGGGAGAAGASGLAGTASGAAAGRAAPSGSLNTVGASSITGPSGPTIGAASTIQANPNNLGSGVRNGGIVGTPPAAGPGATLPSGMP